MAVSKFKDFKKKNICDEFIQAYKPVFDAYPELQSLPVYAWGRYYKYELSGEPFEAFPDERGLSRFKRMIDDASIQWDIIKKIDNEHNKQGGKLWIGEWGDYSPNRDDVAKAFDFDGRGGNCLVILKKENGFEVNQISCDSPE